MDIKKLPGPVSLDACGKFNTYATFIGKYDTILLIGLIARQNPTRLFNAVS
jgi:hypothetical protein